MKTSLLIAALLLAGITSGQQTITSISDGNANNPFVWDCSCFPSPNDHVIVNHNITMNVDWIVNGGGSITVNSSGSFIEDSQHRSILIDATGSQFINHGETGLTNLAFTTGGSGSNDGILSLDTSFFVGAPSSFTNSGSMTDLDSIWIEGVFTNSGFVGNGDFWNNGTVDNSGNITADSLLNTGTFISSGGLLTAIDFANTQSFDLTGSSWMDISNNFYNSGTFFIAAGRDVHVQNDFFTGDTIGGSSRLTNNGMVEVFNDFWNADSLDGSGSFCVANYTANTGLVEGTLDFCDNTGGTFDLNTGTVSGTVTFCATACAVGVEENHSHNISVYPNPVLDVLNVNCDPNALIEIYDMSGRLVLTTNQRSGIEVGRLSPGTYNVRIIEKDNISVIRFIKQ